MSHEIKETTENKDIQPYYEGDQSKLYAGILGHHYKENSLESKEIVKKIWKVTLVLAIVTIVEVLAGLYLSHTLPKWFINTAFIIMTVYKSYFIVKVFMHLGDEVKFFRFLVLIPLILLVWFIIAFLAEGSFWLHINNTNPARFDFMQVK